MKSAGSITRSPSRRRTMPPSASSGVYVPVTSQFVNVFVARVEPRDVNRELHFAVDEVDAERPAVAERQRPRLERRVVGGASSVGSVLRFFQASFIQSAA